MNKLINVIKDYGFNSATMAKELGITQGSCYTLLNGENPSYSKLRLIAEKLGIKTWELVKQMEEDENNIHPSNQITQGAVPFVCPHCKHNLYVRVDVFKD